MNQPSYGGNERLYRAADRTERRNRRRRQSNIPPSLKVPLAVVLIFVVYVLCNFAFSHYRPIETTPAIQVTSDDAITAAGYFIRDEKVVNIGSAETARYNFTNGDKVAMNTSLITIYKNTRSLEKSQQLEEINGTIAQLEVLQGNSYATNTSQIDQKITNSLTTIGDYVDTATFSQIADSIEGLRALALKSGSMNGDITDIGDRLETLYAQKEQLEQELVGRTDEIISDYSGYFCQSTDGLEDKLTMDRLDSYSVRSIEKLTSNYDGTMNADQCKIVDSFTWYFAATMSADDADRLSVGQEVILRFAAPNDHVIGTVYDIRPDEKEQNALVLFWSDDMNSELVGMRKEVGDIIISSCRGLKVPKDAIRMQDDQMGVYILNKTVASFKKVEPIYEGRDYYIVKQKILGDDSLVVDDDIIVHAKDIDDKKVVR